MEDSKINKVEEIYLKVFRVVIIAVMTLTLILSVVMVLKGTSEYFATPSAPEPAKKAPPPNISVDKFLNEIDKKEQPPTPQPQPKPEENKPEVKDTSLDDMVEKYLANLWIYFDQYQKKCSPPNQLEKDAFFKGFPKQIMKGWFQSFGKEFAESQDKFEKAVLSNDRVIKICVEKQGKAGILFRSLDWHREQWVEELKKAEKFERDEAARVKKFEMQEAARVAMKKAEAFSSLITALSAFGMFMLVALILIFSKIETNLRGVKIIEKGD